MKTKAFLFSTLYMLSLNTFAEITPNDIVKKADLKRGLGTISHSMDVAITDQDNKKESYHVAFQDIDHTLVEQTEPERARGVKLLMVEYDIWLFSPNIKKALRISFEQKLTGQVANGDISRTNYAQDYDATLLAPLKSDENIYRLLLKAKNNKVTYGKIEYLVSKKDYSPISATFYALSGKPLKFAKFSDFKLIQGVSRSTKMIIQDYLQKSKVSTMVFSGHKSEKFNESLFNKDRLEF